MVAIGCQSPDEATSDWAREVLGDPAAGTFRGHQLGDSLPAVRERETFPLHLEDEFGLVFLHAIGPEEEARLEYMAPLDGGKVLEAILLNAFLGNEARATDRYSETEAWLRQRHGVPEGSFGQYQWKDADRGLEISLRLLSDKKSFSLNFARLDAL